MKRTPLKRKTPLRGGGMLRRTPFKAKVVRIAPMSAKRKADAKVYSAKRKAFLSARPVCEICGKSDSQDVHHVHGRLGGNYLLESTWKAVCRSCHDWVHTHPKEARERGLLV